MNVLEMAEKLDLKLVAGEEGKQREVNDVYIGDLLSRVISHAKKDGAWVTIMQNVNVCAVALLADVSCIILAEGVEPDENLKARCDKEEIALLTSSKGAYEIACDFCKLV